MSIMKKCKNILAGVKEIFVKIARWLEVEFKTSKRIDKWVEKHIKQGCVSHASAGEQFVYEFLPSGIVECQTVKCLCCKEEFTDYVD